MLVRGHKAEDVISRLQGIRCGMKPTSCPDQLAIALAEAVRRIDQNKTVTNEQDKANSIIAGCSVDIHGMSGK